MEKLEKHNRRFVYHIELEQDKKWANWLLKALRPDHRPYSIHVNLQKDATSDDQLQSFFLCRLIDHYLAGILLEQHPQLTEQERWDKISGAAVNKAIRRAEWEFNGVLDFEKQVR